MAASACKAALVATILYLCGPIPLHGATPAVPGSERTTHLSLIGTHQRIILRTVLPWTAQQVAADTLGYSLTGSNPALKITTLAPGMRMDSIEIIGEIEDTRQSFLTKLRQHPGVEFAHPDRIHKTKHGRRLVQQVPSSPNVGFSGSLDVSAANATVNTSDYEAPQVVLPAGSPNDPAWSAQWDKRLIGLSARNMTKTRRTDFPGAWARTNGSSDVIVCVIDTGIDYNHPDLRGNMWTNPGEIPNNGIDDDGNGYVDDYYGYNFVTNTSDPMDHAAHGTHCAGNIGAMGNNSQGISGVSPSVKLMACRAITGLDGHLIESAAIACIDYAVQMGAHITSNSWGGYGSDPLDTALLVAIRHASDAGQLFVAAAGNDGLNNDVYFDVPSSFSAPNILAVAASGIQDELTDYTNYGEQSVLLAAPGSYILSTVPGNRYFKLSGTSMAAPQVAGAAALILSVYAEAGANITGRSAELISIINQSVEVVHRYYSYYVSSGGRLNVGTALLGIPDDLSVFQTNPNAPLPFIPPDAAVPALDWRNDLYVRTLKPYDPGNEISDGATQVPTEARSILDGSKAWYTDKGMLRGHTARYGCACSSCLGPEAVYTFNVPVDLPSEWLAFTVSAEPSSNIVLSIFRQGQIGDPNIVSYPGTSKANLTDDQYMVNGPCGGIKDATVSMPIQAGGQYHVIVDGLAGYDGGYNVSFTSRPLAQEVKWEDITSSRGFSQQGNLTRDGLPMFACFNPCPLLGCEDNNDVIFHFTAGKDALLRIATTPYDARTETGTVPTIGDICQVQSTGFLIGDCSLFDANDTSATCSLLNNGTQTAGAGTHNDNVLEVQVAQGQEYFVSVDGLAYADDYSISIMVPPALPDDPAVEVLSWADIVAAGDFGVELDGNLSSSSSYHQCPQCTFQNVTCQGPSAPYAFTAQDSGSITVQALPFFTTSDLGFEAYFDTDDDFWGVQPTIYEETGSGAVQLLRCGGTPSLLHDAYGDYHYQTVTFAVTALSKYYLVMNSVASPGFEAAGFEPYADVYQAIITFTSASSALSRTSTGS